MEKDRVIEPQELLAIRDDIKASVIYRLYTPWYIRLWHKIKSKAKVSE